MRCEFCPDTSCPHRLTAGPCIVLISEKLVEELEIEFDPILRAASDLVDAVEKYVNPKKGEYLHRSELLVKVKELKEILNR